MLPVTPGQDSVELSAEILHEIAESIWNSILELEIRLAENPPVTFPIGERVLTGQVNIHGSWRGFLVLVCPRSVACKAAAVMFKTAPASLTETELLDTVGELTHMLGGNLKSLLPAPSYLSLPVVTEGYNKEMAGRPAGQILLRCEGQPLQISLFEQE